MAFSPCPQHETGCHGWTTVLNLVIGQLWGLSGISSGSLLFLAIIWDLGPNVSAPEALILKYVDDTKVIKGVANEKYVVFQETMEKVYQ